MFFLESICDDPQVIEQNLKEVKINGPDYCHQKDPDVAMTDFNKRIEHYKKAYQTIDPKLDRCLYCYFSKIYKTITKSIVFLHQFKL